MPFSNIIWFAPNGAQSPDRAFNILLVPQGLQSEAPSSVLPIVRPAWTKIAAILFGNTPVEPSIAVYTLSGQSPFPDFKVARDANSGQLSIDTAALTSFLAGSAIKDRTGQIWNASQVWPPFGIAGIGLGGLVVILNNAVPGELGELYELQPSDANPIPVVGVTIDGTPNWANVAARALAQKLASLADEFERDGVDFSIPPEGYLPRTPNLYFTSAETRTAIANAAATASIATVAAEAAQLWRTAFDANTPVVMRTDETANPPITSDQRSKQTIGLIEGGGLYRHNVFRANFDCLMRRIPLSANNPAPSTDFVVQQPVGFCRACKNILSRQLGQKSEILVRRPLSLDDQRLEFDRVGNWRNREAPQVIVSSKTIPFTGVGHRSPRWSFTLEVGGSTSALTIMDLVHEGRKDVLALVAQTVLSSIQFTDLSVKLTDGTTDVLTTSEGLANQEIPALLEIATDGGPAHEYDFGCKLTLTWNRSGRIYEVASSVVLKAANNDIDPGHAVMANKIYPQIAFRHRLDPNPQSALKEVQAFEGTISLGIENAIPDTPDAKSTLTPFGLDGLASGRMEAAAFADGNHANLDSEYDAPIAPVTTAFSKVFGPIVAEAPSFPLRDGNWKSGRKLARVVPVFPPNARTFGGGAAWFEYHENRSVPVLPLWSWIFDYVLPDLDQNGIFPGVYSASDPGPDGTRGRERRTLPYPWPPPEMVKVKNNYLMTIMKMDRQGFYDNLHIHPAHAVREFTEGPFCADNCLHIHWRWGVLAGAGPDPYSFYGWGDGRRGHGGHTTLGAPLLPPNQHLDIDFKITPAGDRIDVGYKVRVLGPEDEQLQVLFEQGVGFAFSYEGSLRPIDLMRLSLAVNAFDVGLNPVPPYPFKEKLATLEAERAAADNKPFDADVRNMFHNIYEKIQFYEADVDAMTTINVQQIPMGNVPPAAPDQTKPEEK